MMIKVMKNITTPLLVIGIGINILLQKTWIDMYALF